MALKASFPQGTDLITVSGLFQWDYGQALEIESSDIGSEIVEVHFASSNMIEAIVRSCSFSNGVGTVIIPDTCLEQSKTISAWVYQISGTQGHTTKTILLPITERTRPSIAPDIPAVVYDKYTELITSINEAVDALEKGTVTAAKATDAVNANYAGSAANAASANFSTTAQIAQYASADTSKGTIEERLTALGFKEGAVSPVTDSTAYINYLCRQGNYVLGTFTGYYKNGYTMLGTIPEAFRPNKSVTLYGAVHGYCYETALGGIENIGAPVEVKVDPNGDFYISNTLTETTSLNPQNVYISFGYDIKA